MARKNYPDEFKRDAVALYRDTEGATITQIAEELGISGVTLSAWCKAAGVPISLLMPPFRLSIFEPEGVELTVQFSRFHVGGNHAVHGGVLPLLFDSVFGMVIHAAGRPISRTAFLHVDYRKVTPIDTTLTARGWIRETDGRKAFVNAELRDPDGNVLAEANGLMVRLLAGQP